MFPQPSLASWICSTFQRRLSRELVVETPHALRPPEDLKKEPSEPPQVWATPHLHLLSDILGLSSLKPFWSFYVQHDWTTGAAYDGDDWKKFHVISRSRPLYPLILYLCVLSFSLTKEGLL